MQQKHLNIVGVVLLAALVTGIGYYLAGGYREERAEILKERRMRYYSDSLRAEESLLNLKILRHVNEWDEEFRDTAQKETLEK